MLLVVPHIACNIHCKYCYERNYRKKNPVTMDYDLEVILKKMEELKNIHPEMCLHGGEPLMMKKEDVRKILLKIKELTGKSSIQTNGTLIDDEFIEIFKECSTNVGLSYDGPADLSKYRFYKLRKPPNIEQKIEKMIQSGVNVSMIMVISKANAGTDNDLRKLKNYLLELNKMKISGRLNPCGGAPECELDEKRIIKVYLNLAEFCLHNNLRWSPFTDIVNGLRGKSRVCTFMGCDIFHTPSAAELLGDGSLTNCMRANDEHILLRHPVKHNTRDEILSQAPYEFYGCQNCRYWNACHGGCPTMAIDNDWRNRTYLCPLWFSLFEFYEKALNYLGEPIRLCPDKEIKPISQKKDDSEHEDWQDHQDHYDASHADNLPEKSFPDQDKNIKEKKDEGIEHLDQADVDRPAHEDSPHEDSFWQDHQDH